MGATKNECIDSLREHGFKVATENSLGDLIIKESLLNERDEERAGSCRDGEVGIQGMDGLAVSLAADGCASSDHPDLAATGSLHGCGGTRLQNTDHRNRVLGSECRHREGGGRVAGHHDHLGPFREEKI